MGKLASKAPQSLGPVGNIFRFELGRIRVWELVLAPGESSAWHHHEVDYAFVVMEGGRLRTEYDDGTVAEREYQVGDVVFNQRCSTHRVTNVGSSRWRNIIIELKEPSQGLAQGIQRGWPLW